MDMIFYKDNQVSGKFEKPISEIMVEFYKTPESRVFDIPFERRLLTFLMSYGSFDTITDEQWNEIHKKKNSPANFEQE